MKCITTAVSTHYQRAPKPCIAAVKAKAVLPSRHQDAPLPSRYIACKAASSSNGSNSSSKKKTRVKKQPVSEPLFTNTQEEGDVDNDYGAGVVSQRESVPLPPDDQDRIDKIAALISDRLEQMAFNMGSDSEDDDDLADDTETNEQPDTFVDFLGDDADLEHFLAETRELFEDAATADINTSLPSSSPSSSQGRPRGSTRPRIADRYIPDDLLPKVAIVGRPNVGKSALFNRIVGSSVAIVYDTPGITRDRLYTRAFWGGREFMLVDTGGLMSDATKMPTEAQMEAAMKILSADGLPLAIERQAAAAVTEASCLIMVVDGQTGSTAIDDEVVGWLRKVHSDKPVVLAVNKCENQAKADLQAAEFWDMGLEPFPVSAISGSGTGDLLDQLVKALPPPPAADLAVESDPDTISLAIIGRPNVGKSSLLNAICGRERSIVSSVAGTTRDAVDTDVIGPGGQSFKLIDTAGVRKRASIASGKDGAEGLMVERAFRAVRRAEIAILVIDATEGITQQDFRLAEYVAAEGRACVVVVNKWDLVPDKTDTTLADFELEVRAQLRPIEWANIVFTSAKTGQRVRKVLDAAVAAAEEHRRRVSTATLNLVIREAVGWRAPPSQGMGKRGRVYYATQAGIKPPTFVMFCNDAKLFAEDYKKYMERQLRENIGFPGSPLRLYWRGKRGGNNNNNN